MPLRTVISPHASQAGASACKSRIAAVNDEVAVVCCKPCGDVVTTCIRSVVEIDAELVVAVIRSWACTSAALDLVTPLPLPPLPFEPDGVAGNSALALLRFGSTMESIFARGVVLPVLEGLLVLVATEDGDALSVVSFGLVR